METIKNNSFDGLINYPIAKLVAPMAYKLNITPNTVTITNIFLRVYILYRFITKDFSLTTLGLLLLTHFLDCLDGTIARDYNQTSELGKTLDATSDKIFWIIVTFIATYHLRNKHHIALLIIVLSLIIFYYFIICFEQNNCKVRIVLENNASLLAIFLYVLLRLHL